MVAILTVVSVVLAVLAVAQLVRVFEVTARLKGGTSVLPTDSENKYQGSMMFLFMLAYFAFFAWCIYMHRGRVKSQFIGGCINPGQVLSIRPPRVAVFTDLLTSKASSHEFLFSHSSKGEILFTVAVTRPPP